MPICVVCDEEVSHDHITIHADKRALSFCWDCAEANTHDPEARISVPELVEKFDTHLH